MDRGVKFSNQKNYEVRGFIAWLGVSPWWHLRCCQNVVI